MTLKICILVAVAGLFAVSLCEQHEGVCPDFAATFVGVIDQTIDNPRFVINDLEQTFFKEIMGFRDDDIQHAFEDAITSFNETYGLDFSLSQPNEQHEYFFENAKMNLFRFSGDIHYLLALSNWIQTGNTRFTCREIYDGGFLVTFTGDQLLHGSYGGDDGIPAGVGDSLDYGFTKIDVCDQSPVIIQFKTATPFRSEPVDGSRNLNFDIYNRVLGHGKALGAYTVKPDLKNPGKFRFVARVVFTFPTN